MKRHIAFFFMLILSTGIYGAQDSLQQNIPVHDPVMTRQDGIYYLFTFYDYCRKAEKGTYKIRAGVSDLRISELTWT